MPNHPLVYPKYLKRVTAEKLQLDQVLKIGGCCNEIVAGIAVINSEHFIGNHYSMPGIVQEIKMPYFSPSAPKMANEYF